MWLLSCEGDLFGGRRLWLRPGTSHLLGRTSGKSAGGERVQYIDHKSVSRKHLILQVSELKAGDDTQLFSKTEIKAVDSSKTGTTINDDKINQDTKTLDGTQYTIRLGSYASVFHLTWHPVVLSFANLPKSGKAKDDAFAAQRAALKSIDVKVASEYLTNQTTHLITKKRNTAASLQALVQAKWVITDGFVDSLAKVCERQGEVPDGSPRTSPLEEDFDANWPKEVNYIVPVGGEPVGRPDHYLKPDSRRAEVFEKFTFVFLTQSQHDQLMPVITSGGGKAVMFACEPGRSQVEGLVNYVKSLASKKTTRPSGSDKESSPGGIVVVRISEKEQGRSPELMSSIDQAMSQRSVEQSEFLDPILLNDASSLCTPLRDATQSRVADHSVGIQEPAAQNLVNSEQAVAFANAAEGSRNKASGYQEQSGEQPTQPSDVGTQRRTRRMVTQSRFKGFNEFDPSQMIRADSNSPEPEIFSEEVINSPPQQGRSEKEGQRKRAAPPMDAVTEEREMLDSVLPGATALKRRRLEALENGQTDDLSHPATSAKNTADKVSGGTKKGQSSQIIDVKGTLKERRRREEQRGRQDEEILQNELDIDITGLKDLAQVEEFQLPVRAVQHRASERNNAVGENWDPSWNGRKNFKKFRHKGQPRDHIPTLSRTLVRLEEVPRRGHGLNDDYWLASSPSSRGQNKSQSQPGSVLGGPVGGDGDDRERFQRRIQISLEEDAENAGVEDTLPEEVAGVGTSNHSLVAATAQGTAAKRAATQSFSRPAKKQRQATLASPLNLASQDEEDALRFRRKGR